MKDSKVEQLHSRARSLVTEFNQGRGANFIEEAIALDREALELCPPNHTKRSVALTLLAEHLDYRYSQLGRIEDLEEAIVLDRESLALRPPGNSNRPITLTNLAVHLYNRYRQLGTTEDIDEAIALDRESLALRTPNDPARSIAINNLAVSISTRYRRRGDMEDLNEAIDLGREALALRPPGHRDRPISLENLAVLLSDRYGKLGKTEDLEAAIVLGQDALALRPPSGPDRLVALNSLATCFSARYKQLGKTEDLDRAIVFSRDFLMLLPPGRPNRSIALNNLAAHLTTRYDLLGTIQDLDEAIVLCRDVLATFPPGNPQRLMSLNNLATCLYARYQQLKAVEALDEAISLARDTLALLPQGHPRRSHALNNLAGQLSARYEKLGRVEDVNEAIVLHRDALVLRPLGDPDRPISLNNLSIDLFTRYKRLEVMEDLDEAIILIRETLQLRPPGHPNRLRSLNSLASYLHARFKQSSQSEDEEELSNAFVQLVQIAQVVSFYDLSTARKCIRVAEESQHPMTIQIYETCLRLLIHYIATLPSLPQHLSVLKKLVSSLAVDAFSACVRRGVPTRAVELLEQGRGVFWSQLSRLRSRLDDAIALGPTGKMLADEFTRLSSLVRKALDSSSEDQHDRVFHLGVELQSVITGIRELPGLSRFLLPSLFPDLQQAACEGPVIIVNASQYSCDAVVVLIDQDPVHIPLSITKDDIRQVSSIVRTLTKRAKCMNVTNHLAIVLRALWDHVVLPIVNFLQTKFPRGSRIWWCPTAEFSLVPLHAAGPYRKGQQNLTGIYISSYTPTLSALIRARRPLPSSFAEKQRRFVAIGLANATGESQLLTVGTELDTIGQRVDGIAQFTSIEGPESTISRVSEELGKAQWVHLACHGLPNPKHPFESAFALHDGHFTIQHLIQCQLENPEFAYLSACHTTVGDAESPDEVIHLASAMQFAGFRSVIGTMWAVDDGQTNRITSMFYDNMVDEAGRLDHTRAALALHRTMRRLVDVPFDQRILYVHLGA